MSGVDIERLQIVDLRPGDVIVAGLPDECDDYDFEMVARLLAERFPGHRTLVLSASVDLAAYRPVEVGS